MAYRETGRACPSCRGPFFAENEEQDDLERWTCAHCGARLVSFARLAQEAPQLREVLFLGASVVALDPRPCPRCAAPMRVQVHEDLTLDLCEQHGVWFDSAELETLARRAGDRIE